MTASGESAQPSGRRFRALKSARRQRLGNPAPSTRQLIARLRAAPFTLGYVGLLWTAAVVSWILHAFPDEATRAWVAASASSLFSQPWSIVTSAFWMPGPVFYVVATGVVLLAGIPLERWLGSRVFAAAALASQTLGIMTAAALVWAMRPALGSWSTDLMSHRYLGPSAALCGVVLASTSAMPALWRRRVRITVPVLLLVLAVYEGSFADLVRLSAAVAGLLLGPVLSGRRPSFKRPAFSPREARVLVALSVASCAVGPVIAGLSPHAPGPLAVLRFLFTDIQPVDAGALQDACSSSLKSSQCEMMLLQLRAGAGGIFMAILPCFLLLLCAEGLRRGRRFAWRSTLVVLGSMAVLGVTHIAGVLWPAALGTPQAQNLDFQDLSQVHHPLGLVVPLLLPVFLFLLIAGFHHLFTVTAPPGTYVKLARRVLTLGAGLAVVYVFGGLATAGGFKPVPSLAQFVADVPDRFLPLGYTLDISPAIFPESTVAVLLYEGIGIIFWTLTSALVLHSFLQPSFNEDGTDPSRVREILRSGAGSPLSWMTTWPSNRYWFAPEGRGYVAYRVIFGIALALGPPIGPVPDARSSVEGFARFCSDNGWTPCFYTANQALRDITRAMGWGSIEVAQQAIISLPALSFSGKRFQDVRTALNRARKEGLCAEWFSYAKAPSRIRQQIDELSEEWIADQKLPELGFTLGGVAELRDPEVRCLLALGADLTLQAVTSWLPVYRHGRIEGWTLDMMRRRRNGFPNSMEFLIASAALSLRDEGYDYISLSGVPLARHPDQEADDGGTAAVGRLLEWVGSRLEPVYGFRSLMAFKNKFAPRYEPLYLVYPDAAALPSTANAIGMAYLGEIPSLRRLALARQLFLPRLAGIEKRRPG